MEKKVFINGKIISNGTIYDGYNLFTAGNRIRAINQEKFDVSSYH